MCIRDRLFIDGHFTHNGWLCIRRDGVSICGDYQSWIVGHYKIVRNREVLTSKDSKKVIRVVRQRCKWDTFRILCHELMHWLFEFLPDKLESKLDNWLDRK